MEEHYQPVPTPAPQFLTPRQAAEYLTVSIAWLAQHRKLGTGPAYAKLGLGKTSPVRYRKDEIVSWMAARETPRQS